MDGSANNGPGLAGRMIRSLIVPRRTFASIREQMTWLDWFVPTLVLMAASLAGGLTLSAHMPPVPEAEISLVSMALDSFDRIVIHSFLWLFAAGGILLLLANTFLGVEASYCQMLAVTAYASLAKVVEGILIMAVILVAGRFGSINPNVLGGSQIFTIWQILVMAVGTAVMAGCATLRALVAVLVIWGLWWGLLMAGKGCAS